MVDSDECRVYDATDGTEIDDDECFLAYEKGSVFVIGKQWGAIEVPAAVPRQIQPEATLESEQPSCSSAQDAFTQKVDLVCEDKSVESDEVVEGVGYDGSVVSSEGEMGGYDVSDEIEGFGGLDDSGMGMEYGETERELEEEMETAKVKKRLIDEEPGDMSESEITPPRSKKGKTGKCKLSPIFWDKFNL